ncbi:MAG: hypothetical protein K2G64_08375 [Muribaculaceae bacterium]|nr:hypothetical protein [Muribaculaceae bacterium]
MKKLFLMAIAVLALVSCSTTPSERVVTVSDPEFSGFAAKYLEVVDGDYKFITDGREGKITLKLRKKAQPDEPFYSDGFTKFRLNAVGDGGEIYDTGVYGYEASMGEFDKIEDLLTNGEVGDTRSVCFTWMYMAQDDFKDVRNKIYNSATGIELIDKGFKAGIKPEKASSVKEDVAEAGDDYEIIMAEAAMDDADDADSDEVEEQKPAKAKVSSKEIDKFIDKFEKLTDKAIKMYKKSEAGERGTYGKWLELSHEITEMMESAKFDESDMTPSQIQRMFDISNKYHKEVYGTPLY